jgi:phosphoenolpyruvate synthase/pyruvate phosphate dikinase
MDHIRSIRSVSLKDIDTVGGKAARLGEVSRIVPVSPGFVILKGMFDEFVDMNNLRSKIKQALASDKDARARLEDIRALLVTGTLTEDMKEAISEAYYSLNIDAEISLSQLMTTEDPVVVVSATRLDPERGRIIASVKGLNNLCKEILACYATAYGTEAVEKRDYAGIAVMFDKMLRPDYSGIVRKRGSEVVVFGRIGPEAPHEQCDEYILSEHNEIKTIVVNKQPSALIAQGESLMLVSAELPIAQATVQKLTDQQIHAVARIGLQAMQAFSEAVDVHFIIEGNQAYVIDIESYKEKPKQETYPLDRKELLEILAIENTKALLSYDLVIYNALKTKYEQLFSHPAELGYSAIIDAIKQKAAVPHEADIKWIRELTVRWKERGQTVSVDELKAAFEATERFLGEF